MAWRIAAIIDRGKELNPDLLLLWHSDGDFGEIVDDAPDMVRVTMYFGNKT